MTSREAVASNDQLQDPSARDNASIPDVQSTVDRVTPANPPSPQADESRKR